MSEGLQGYFKTLAAALDDIRTEEMRCCIVNAKSLNGAIDRLIKFDKDFNDLLAPLKKLEN